MRKVAAISLILFAVFAGCSAISPGTPAPQEEPAPVKLVNNATITETYTIAVVDVGANLTVTRRDGQKYELRIPPGASTTKTSTENKNIKIEFPDSAHLHGNYTLKPGEEKTLSVDGIAPNEAIVILIYDEPEQSYRAIHTVSCESPIRGVRATSKSGGPEDWTTGTHQCGA